jgi:hypothetical protein
MRHIPSSNYAIVGGAAFFILRMALKERFNISINGLSENESFTKNLDIIVHKLNPINMNNPTLLNSNIIEKIDIIKLPSFKKNNIRMITVNNKNFPIAKKSMLMAQEREGANLNNSEIKHGENKRNKHEKRIFLYKNNAFINVLNSNNSSNNNSPARSPNSSNNNSSNRLPARLTNRSNNNSNKQTVRKILF